MGFLSEECQDWLHKHELWNLAWSGRPALPACITTEPYGCDRDRVEQFARKHGLVPRFLDPSEGLYCPGKSHFIQLWVPESLEIAEERREYREQLLELAP